jgi:hypothetical protein
VLDEAVGIEAHDLPVAHGHHEHASVRQPAEPRRGVRHLDDRLDLTTEVDGLHRVVEEVREVQPPVVPARSLAEVQAIEQQRGLARSHGRHPGTPEALVP